MYIATVTSFQLIARDLLRNKWQ